MEIEHAPIDPAGLDPYYQEEFKKIRESNETYKGKWNWWAFVFNGLWCLVKGCWVYAILIILTGSFIKISTEIRPALHVGFAIGSLVWALVMGWRGTWIYYNVKIKKQQFPRLN